MFITNGIRSYGLHSKVWWTFENITLHNFRLNETQIVNNFLVFKAISYNNNKTIFCEFSMTYDKCNVSVSNSLPNVTNIRVNPTSPILCSSKKYWEVSGRAPSLKFVCEKLLYLHKVKVVSRIKDILKKTYYKASYYLASMVVCREYHMNAIPPENQLDLSKRKMLWQYITYKEGLGRYRNVSRIIFKINLKDYLKKLFS